MGLFGSMFGGGGPGYTPIKYNPVQLQTGNMQFGEDLLKKKMTDPITGLDQAGQVGVDLNNQRLNQDLSQARALNQGATDTSIANAGLYGTDRGAVSRMSQAGMDAGAKTTQGLMQNASNQNLMTTQNNLQNQIDQKNMVQNNAMGIFGAIPDIQNKGIMYNSQMQSQYDQANAQGQALADQAAQKRKSGLFSAIGGGLGLAFGGPMGGMAGSTIGGMFA